MDTNGFFDDLDFGDFSAPSSGSSRKVPICLVLDCSGSMRYADGTKRPKIDELNYNIDAFLEYVRNDPKASKICDLCIITMGDSVHVISRYNTVDRIHFGHFAASGGTPLGTAMKTAIDLLTERRQYYRDNDIEHYKHLYYQLSSHRRYLGDLPSRFQDGGEQGDQNFPRWHRHQFQSGNACAVLTPAQT